MTQPDLGRKIAELRKARGLTQEELVETCNLSVRTLQRIESGEVSPRSYTLKVIFSALEYDYFQHGADSERTSVRIMGFVSRVSGAVGWFIKDLFQLKTHTMKKITILTVTFGAVFAATFFLTTDTNAQSAKKAEETIRNASEHFAEWFNTGQIDSLKALYHEDACLLSIGCGKQTIGNFYREQHQLYKFKAMTMSELKISKKLAVEKGTWTVAFFSGQELSGEYLTQWELIDGEWLITNDISDSW